MATHIIHVCGVCQYVSCNLGEILLDRKPNPIPISKKNTEQNMWTPFTGRWKMFHVLLARISQNGWNSHSAASMRGSAAGQSQQKWQRIVCRSSRRTGWDYQAVCPRIANIRIKTKRTLALPESNSLRKKIIIPFENHNGDSNTNTESNCFCKQSHCSFFGIGVSWISK